VIPQIFDAMNKKLMFDDEPAARFGYNWETQFGGKASDCVSCGACESVCPQKLPIIEKLRDAALMFGQ
jgi:predicted aldo/keto reductase-like oxidoreductase